MKKKRFKSEGHCNLCGKNFEGGKISGHLEECRGKLFVEDKGAPANIMQISVYGRYNPEFWLQLAAWDGATLSDIDDFLRHAWLECCGHLSSFTIGGVRYESHPDYDDVGSEDGEDDFLSFGGKTLSMSVKLNKVLGLGTVLRHEYDFGTTTELELEVLDVFQASEPNAPVILLAHNLMPKIKCSTCEKNATLICSVCSYDFLCFCKKCARKHECGEEMMLPLVNSPRTGMCGYEGPGL
ncbi:MAG: hypothetical protein WCP55_00305 [Lentisphaerota bacterium]